MIADVKSPADPPRAATREQKSPIEIEHSNKGLPRQQLISQSVAQSSVTATEKVCRKNHIVIWRSSQID
jgi:hypothetical protein